MTMQSPVPNPLKNSMLTTPIIDPRVNPVLGPIGDESGTPAAFGVPRRAARQFALHRHVRCDGCPLREAENGRPGRMVAPGAVQRRAPRLLRPARNYRRTRRFTHNADGGTRRRPAGTAGHGRTTRYRPRPGPGV